MTDNGMREFHRRMEAIPVAVRQALEKELLSAANLIAGEQRRRAPKGASRRLLRSIRVEWRNDLSIAVRAGGPLTTVDARGTPDSVISAFVLGLKEGLGGRRLQYDYALAVEFGTAKMEPEPFFWPGYRAVRKIARQRVKRAASKAAKAAFEGRR